MNFQTKQLLIFRSIFSIYLIIYTLKYAPYIIEMFSTEGILPDKSANWSYNIITQHFSASPEIIVILWAILAFSAVLLLCGIHQNISAGIAWFVWMYTYNLNNLALDPSIPFVGWMLLFLTITKNPGTIWDPRNIELPRISKESFWIVFGLGYFFAGFSKATESNWLAGKSLLLDKLQIESAFSIIEILRNFPIILEILAVQVVVIQITCILTFLLPILRPIGFILLTSMWVFSLFTFNIYFVILPMLIGHIMLIEKNWMQYIPFNKKIKAFIEGD